MTADLHEELADAVTRIPPDRLAYLTNLGIPEDFVCRGPNRIGFAEIETNGDFFEPADEGQPVIVVAEIDADFEPVDLVAFDPATPGRWWLRLGAADLLGAANLGERAFPTMVHPNPLRWLQAGGTGICIINWSFDPLARLAFAGVLKAPAHIKRRLEKRVQQAAAALFQIEVCHDQ